MSVTESVRARVALPWPGLLALAAAVFLSITIEMLPMGLLPEMSADLGVGEPLIGLLVSVFAFTVVVTSAPLTAATARMPRRALLVGVLLLLAVATAASAVVPEYWMLAAVRVVGGIAHGLFWAIVTAYTSRLVPEQMIGRAVAVVLGGGTLALVGGVPAATALGQALGWRPAFAIVAALTVVGALVVLKVVPPVGRGDEGADAAASADGRARTGLRDAALTRVLAVCLVTAVTMIGQYAVYTYVSPLITDLMGWDAAAVGPLLLVYGVAGALGLVLTGLPIARRTTAAAAVSMLVAAVALVVLALGLGPWTSLVAFAVWGLAFGAIPPLLQTRLLQAAPAAQRDAASALYTTAFNIGIGGGALVGGVLFGALGVAALPLGYAALLVVSVALLVTGRAPARRARSASARPASTAPVRDPGPSTV